MTASPTAHIETERLILRPPTSADADAWVTRLTGDPEVMRYIPMYGMTPLARAERTITNFGRIWERDGTGAWVITRSADAQLIGYCYVGYLADVSAFELGYAIARSEWGQGVVTEAARAAVRFAFEHGSMDHIMAIVVPENAASARVLGHLGFVYEKDTTLFNMSLAYYTLPREHFTAGDHIYQLTFR